MKLLGLDLTRTKAATSDELGAQLGALDRTRVDAVRELDRLAAMRPTLLVTAIDSELAQHDAAMAQCRRDIERVDAQRAALQPQWQAADRAEEQARRKAAYAKGKRARAEALKVLAAYEPAARAVADILAQFTRLEAEIAAANRQLPDGVEPIPPAEPFRGKADQPGRWESFVERVPVDIRDGTKPAIVGPGTRRYVEYRDIERRRWVGAQVGFQRCPLAQDVNLPALDPNEPAIW